MTILFQLKSNDINKHIPQNFIKDISSGRHEKRAEDCLIQYDPVSVEKTVEEYGNS